MKRIIFSIVMVLVFASTSAFAADTHNWTGFYAGLQGMYGHGESDWGNAGTDADHSINGWMGGLFLGYNYQFPVNVVLGVETDINYGKISGSEGCPSGTYSCRSEVNWLGSTRVRAGYALGRFLPYVGLGVAYGRAEIYTKHRPTDTDYGDTNTYFGWTPSVGLDFAITKNLIARAEYAYYDFGKEHSVVDSAQRIDSDIDIQGIKFGLAWYFGGAKETSPAQEIRKAPAAEQTMIDKGRIVLNVQFDTGKAIVKPAFYKEIEDIADVMKKYPDLKIVVEGHTDNVGGEKFNLNLSQRRAEAIKAVMVNNFKIESSRVTAKGFGYSNPLVDNDTIEGKQKNRRAEASAEYTVKK